MTHGAFRAATRAPVPLIVGRALEPPPEPVAMLVGVAVPVGFGPIPLVAPNDFKQMSDALHPLLESGIRLAALSALALNLFFDGLGSRAGARAEATRLAHAAEA